MASLMNTPPYSPRLAGGALHWYRAYTLYSRELRRFLNMPPPTLIAPTPTTSRFPRAGPSALGGAVRVTRDKNATSNAVMKETMTGVKVVQLWSREKRKFEAFDEVNASHRDAWKRSIHYDSMLFSAVEAAEGLTVAIIVWQGTGMAQAGTLYVFVAWMRRCFLPLRDLSAQYSVMPSSMASPERAVELMSNAPAVRAPEPERRLEGPSSPGPAPRPSTREMLFVPIGRFGGRTHAAGVLAGRGGSLRGQIDLGTRCRQDLLAGGVLFVRTEAHFRGRLLKDDRRGGAEDTDVGRTTFRAVAQLGEFVSTRLALRFLLFLQKG